MSHASLMCAIFGLVLEFYATPSKNNTEDPSHINTNT